MKLIHSRIFFISLHQKFKKTSLLHKTLSTQDTTSFIQTFIHRLIAPLINYIFLSFVISTYLFISLFTRSSKWNKSNLYPGLTHHWMNKGHLFLFIILYHCQEYLFICWITSYSQKHVSLHHVIIALFYIYQVIANHNVYCTKGIEMVLIIQIDII